MPDLIPLSERPELPEGWSWAEGGGLMFAYQELPHEAGVGKSYNINLALETSDVIHIDTKPDTVFEQEDICAIGEYWRLSSRREFG